MHVPFHKGRVCDKPMALIRNPDEEQDCYSLPEEGVDCVHFEMEVEGSVESFTMRRFRSKIPSKFNLIKFLKFV